MRSPSPRRFGASLGWCALGLAVACGGKDASPREAGGQTSDFGSGDEDLCLVVSSEPTEIDQARARGFAVDAQLALLPSHFEAAFHRGTFACGGVPAVTGTIAIDSALGRIIEQHREPVPGRLERASCPDILKYEVDIDLTTDEGSLQGRFRAEVFAAPDKLRAFATAEARDVAGSLGVRVNLARPHTAVLSTQLEFTQASVLGRAFTNVSYADGSERMGSQGDGIFWPVPGNDATCDWLESEASLGSELISLDAYRTRQ